MDKMKLDKTVFKAQSFEEADKNHLFEKSISLANRWKLSFHLTCTIFGIEENTPLKIDRSQFSARKFNK